MRKSRQDHETHGTSGLVAATVRTAKREPEPILLLTGDANAVRLHRTLAV